MLYPRFLLAASVIISHAVAELEYPNIYRRQDANEEGVTVSTLTPESVETSTIEGSTTEIPVTGPTSSWVLGTEASDTTSTSISSEQSTWSVGSSTFLSTYGTEKTEFEVPSGSQSTVTLTAIDTTVTLTSISTVLSIPSLSTVVSIKDLITNLSIEDTSTIVTFDGVTTTVIVSGTSSDVTVTGPPVTVNIAGASSTVEIGATSSSISIDSTTTEVDNQEDTATSITLSYAKSESISLAYSTTEVVVLSRSGTVVNVSLDSTTITLSVPETTVTVTGTGSTTEVTVSAVVTTITLSDTTSSTSIESSDTTAVVGETTESGESTTEGTETSEGADTTATTETTDTTADTSSSSSSALTPTLPPGTNPTYCEAVRGPLTPEEEVQLAVLFGDSSGGTTFADYVVSYASQLVAQIADVANIAVGDNEHAFTTAFDTIDIPGVLGLASAAPIYTCFLSTLWAQALSNPQQYARRAVPSQDEKIKLIVLFEKRATDGMQFDYAELLVDDTNNLIAEVQSVAGAAGAAAVGGDLGAYASLFANVDVAQFLSIATEAPVYTEGLSSAFVTALESYSQNVNRPTSTIMTTHTYTTVSTIVTNVVSGTVTVPTTLFSTVVVTSVGPATSGRETYTSHTTETRVGVTSETVSEVVRESTLPNGQVTRVTERITVGVPGTASPTAAVPAPGERVTVEVVTGANGRVETRTVTIREETRAPAPAQTTRRPNVAVYTQVQNGRTYTHTVEIQTRNNAFKQVLALGAGLFGGLILLL